MSYDPLAQLRAVQESYGVTDRAELPRPTKRYHWDHLPATAARPLPEWTCAVVLGGCGANARKLPPRSFKTPYLCVKCWDRADAIPERFYVRKKEVTEDEWLRTWRRSPQSRTPST